ncbi:MAG: DUF1801 domain-containing protein [Pseudomonadota bacterium]
MTGPKTRATGASVTDFLAGIDDARKRADCKRIGAMMHKATGKRATMWGTSIVGYGRYETANASGKSSSWMECGFSPRAQNIAVYIMPGFKPFAGLLRNLGRHKTGKSCLYIKHLDDVDAQVLEELIVESVKEMRRRYPA